MLNWHFVYSQSSNISNFIQVLAQIINKIKSRNQWKSTHPPLVFSSSSLALIYPLMESPAPLHGFMMSPKSVWRRTPEVEEQGEVKTPHLYVPVILCYIWVCVRPRGSSSSQPSGFYMRSFVPFLFFFLNKSSAGLWFFFSLFELCCLDYRENLKWNIFLYLQY